MHFSQMILLKKQTVRRKVGSTIWKNEVHVICNAKKDVSYFKNFICSLKEDNIQSLITSLVWFYSKWSMDTGRYVVYNDCTKINF